MRLTKKGIFFSLILVFLILIVTLLKLKGGSTPPIKDDEGNIISESIASLEKIKLGDMDQWMLIRGNDISNPVLLWLHGGPGSCQMPVAHYYDQEMEKEFMVVHWDQRGAGKSNPSDFDEETMTFEQFMDDAHELTQYLKKRFNREKIYLVGHSWGSQLGIKLANAYPEDYYAYVAVSQVVDNKLSSKIGYDWLLKQIDKKEKQEDLKRLEKLGSPPFNDHEKYVEYVKMVDSYGGGFDISMKKLLWIALKAPEYKINDYFAWLKGSERGSGKMWKMESYQSFNAIEKVPRLLIPVYFFSGKNDYNTPLQLVEEYFKMLDAPKGKELVIFENSSHIPYMGEPKKFNHEMIRVKEETYK